MRLIRFAFLPKLTYVEAMGCIAVGVFSGSGHWKVGSLILAASLIISATVQRSIKIPAEQKFF